MGLCDYNHYSHFICLECRIGAKAKPKRDERRWCQHCGKPMIEVGVVFRIPAKRDNAAWKQLKIELNNGERYHSKWWAR